MGEFKTKKVFKKNIVTSVKGGEIYIPTLTGSSNWDRNSLAFISGMNELDMRKNGRSIVKEETKISDLRYSISYKTIDAKSSGKTTPNSLLFSTNYTINNCYYVDMVISFETNVSDRGYRIEFDVLCDGKKVDHITHLITTMSQGNLRYTTLKRIRVYPPSLGTHVYTFRNPYISGAIQLNYVKMQSIEKFSPSLTNANNLTTNIVLGENITILQ